VNDIVMVEPAQEIHPVIAVGGPDAWIELHAQAYDAVLPGLGDVLREVWPVVRAACIPCDCAMDPYHRWNCPWTPIWAQTVRDLDVNPWTVFW
jgi:hypothetical protein